jgi:hypothetical protein
VRPFNFAFQPKGAGFYIYMPDTQIGQVQVNFSLKFVAVIGRNRMNSKGVFMNHVVNEIYGTLMGVLLLNL